MQSSSALQDATNSWQCWCGIQTAGGRGFLCQEEFEKEGCLLSHLCI
jgi:hypothetical protein